MTGFDDRLNATYNAALEKGLWHGAYAATHRGEYLAEGAGSWFNSAGQKNPIKTRAALKAYDSGLAALLTEIFGDSDWRYTLPATRTHLPHLQGFDPQVPVRAPGLQPWQIWLLEYEQQLADKNSNGGGRWVDLELYDPSQLPVLLESVTRGAGTYFIYVNLTGQEISFYTVEADGTENFRWRSIGHKRSIGKKSFDSMDLGTYVGEIWLIKDHSGEDLALFRAEEKIGRVLISPSIFETDSDGTNGDINGDGNVNVLDLILITSNLDNRGSNLAADVNGDGVVNIMDLIMVAGMFDNTAAAPSTQPQVPETLTAVEVQGWLTDAVSLEVKDPIMKRGFLVLEQLLVSLTPTETELLSNYPNPFNPETWIPYRLAEDAFVTLTIYNTTGQVVRTLDVGHQIASAYENRSKAIHWDGRNDIGEGVASGVYFYTLSAGDYSATQKMVILK